MYRFSRHRDNTLGNCQTSCWANILIIDPNVLSVTPPNLIMQVPNYVLRATSATKRHLPPSLLTFDLKYGRSPESKRTFGVKLYTSIFSYIIAG
jgi:hypothetical protein